jgi:predicted CDP-diglyceride synthetase/phosphatidate cytidylyltransferase
VTYVKSFLVGVAALLLSIIGIVVIEAITIYFTELRRAGSAGIGAVSVGIPAWWLLIPVTAFIAGFGWEFRRSSRRSRVKPL